MPRNAAEEFSWFAVLHFLTDEADVDSAMLRLGPGPSKKADRALAGEIASLVEAVRTLPWTALEELKGDAEILSSIEEAESLLKALRKNLSE